MYSARSSSSNEMPPFLRRGTWALARRDLVGRGGRPSARAAATTAAPVRGAVRRGPRSSTRRCRRRGRAGRGGARLVASRRLAVVEALARGRRRFVARRAGRSASSSSRWATTSRTSGSSPTSISPRRIRSRTISPSSARASARRRSEQGVVEAGAAFAGAAFEDVADARRPAQGGAQQRAERAAELGRAEPAATSLPCHVGSVTRSAVASTGPSTARWSLALRSLVARGVSAARAAGRADSAGVDGQGARARVHRAGAGDERSRRAGRFVFVATDDELAAVG